MTWLLGNTEGIRKETIVALFKLLTCHLPGVTEANQEIPQIKMGDLREQIWKWKITNKKQKWQLFDGDFRPNYDTIRATTIKICTDNRHSRFLRNVGTYPQHCNLNMVSIATNDRAKRIGPNMGYYPIIFLEGLKKIKRKLKDRISNIRKETEPWNSRIRHRNII